MLEFRVLFGVDIEIFIIEIENFLNEIFKILNFKSEDNFFFVENYKETLYNCFVKYLGELKI